MKKVFFLYNQVVVILKLGSMMTDSLLDLYREQFLKSKKHLEYSFNKVSKLAFISDSSSEEDLESWESFASRFARTSDIYFKSIA